MRRRAGWLMVLAASLCPSAFSQALSQLTCGTVVSGSFNQGPTDFYIIQTDPGDAILVRLVSTSGDPALVPRIQVTDPINRTLTARPSPLTAGADAAGEFDLPAGGPHQIRILAATDAAQGAYRLTFVFLNKPCALATLNCGVGVRGQFASPLETRTYQFQPQAGDVLSARAFRADTGLAVSVAVYSSGKLLMNGNRPLLGQSSGGATRVDFLVGESATLIFVLFEASNRTGNYGFAITRLNRPCGTGTVSCGAITQSSIANPYNVDSFSMAVDPGDVISFRAAAQSGGLVPYLEAYDAKGNALPVTAGTVSTNRVVTTFSLTASGSGPYTLLARDGSSGFSATGSYAVTMVRFNRPCTSQGLTCSSLVDGAVSGLLGATQYTLEANAGDVFQLRLLRTDQGSAFRPRLDIFDSQGLPLQSLQATDVTRGTLVAPVTGTYLLMVTDALDHSQSGTYALTSIRLNRPCGAGNLSCGGAVAGALSRSLASAVYTYNADPGDAFTVRIDSSGATLPSLEIYDSQGNAAGQALGGNYTGLDVASPAGGAYTVIASDDGRRAAGGSFSVALLRTKNGCGATPAQGQPVSGVVSGGAPFVSYTIAATEGDVVAVRSASFTSGFAALMELYDPNGSRLDSQTYSVSRKAAVSGTYTVIVGASAPRTAGGFALVWQLLNSPAGTSPLQCGGTTSASLTAAKQFRYYSASLNAGDLIRMIFTRSSENFTPQVELFDPAGARVAASSDITLKAAAGGNYLVLVSPSSSNGETGSYALAFQRPNNPCGAASLACGQSTLRQVTLPGQLDTLTFNGTGGEQADIRTAVRSGAYGPFLELFDGSGNRTGTSSSGVLQPSLPATGAYTLLVRDRGSVNLGSYRVSLQNGTKACPVNDTEPPSVTLVQPTGGEVIAGGTAFRIQWQSDDNASLATHDIALSSDGGKTFSASVAAGLSGNAQSYTWPVPPDIAPNRNSMIRVTATDAAGNTQSAVSGPLSVIGAGFTANNSVTYTYDSMNRLTSAASSDGRTIKYMWDAAGNLIQVTVQ